MRICPIHTKWQGQIPPFSGRLQDHRPPQTNQYRAMSTLFPKLLLSCGLQCYQTKGARPFPLRPRLLLGSGSKVASEKENPKMAVVRRLELLTMERDSPHTEVDCTY